MSAKKAQAVKGPVVQQVDVEISANQIKELTERLARYKQKCDELTSDNAKLTEIQNASSQDKQDIVEFLSIELKQKDLQISTYDSKTLDFEKDKNDTIEYFERELEDLAAKSKIEYDAVQNEFQMQKSEINQLLEFKTRKDEFIAQIESLKGALVFKDEEHQDNLRAIEKRVFNDKTSLKKEMIAKVNEAVVNFRKVADQQMAETTKRAIKENIAINAHLQKMSVKMVELLAENERLTDKLGILKSEGEILKGSEQELAKRNIGHQRVVQMLTEKLRETDKLLEIAYDTGIMDEINDKMVHSMFHSTGQEVEKELAALKDFTNDLSVELDGAKSTIEEVATFVRAKSSMFRSSPLNSIWIALQKLLPGDNFDNTEDDDLYLPKQFIPSPAKIHHIAQDSFAEEDEELGEIDVVDEFELKPLAFKKPVRKHEKAQAFTHPSRSSFSIPAPQKHENRDKVKELMEDSEWGTPAVTLPKKGFSYMPTEALFQAP